MKDSARYVKIVEWSDEDGCYISSAPDLEYGGRHGDDECKVFDEYCDIVDEIIEMHRVDGTPLPQPSKRRRAADALEAAE